MAIDFFDPKDIQRLYDAEDEQVRAYVARLKNKIERFLNKISAEIEKAGSGQKLNDLVASLSQLSAANLPKEVSSQLNEVTKLYQNRINTLEESFKIVSKATQIFNPKDGQIIGQIISYDKAQIVTTIEQTFNEFKQSAYKGSISGQLPNLRELSAAVSDSLESRLPSDLNTQLAAFQRTVSLQKAEDLGLNYFLYAGGLIKTSREFCIERAGKVFSVAEAKNWDNGQDLPVIPYLGGYNCRHTMVFMDLEKAKENGYKE